MKTRCKFRLDHVEHSDDTSTLRFNAVTDGSEENKKFFKYTPSGMLSLAVVNGDVARSFEQGKEYYVDIEPAEAEVAEEEEVASAPAEQ